MEEKARTESISNLPDVMEMKSNIERLIKEKEISEFIINNLPGVFLIRELNGQILRWNKQLEVISGYTGKEIKELAQFQFFEEKDRDFIRETIQRLTINGKSETEVAIVTKYGESIPMYLIGMLIELEGKTCYLVMGFDMSEKKKTERELNHANEQLRHLSAHLQNVREEERKRIAREIHDELGQQLTSLKMDLSWALKKMNVEHPVSEKFADMGKLIDQTIITVRRIASELRPSILDDLGLSDALDWQSTEFEKRFGVKTCFICEVKELHVNSEVITNLFRIYQESLTNIARHANAKSVLASLQRIEDDLILQITDDGKGFDIQTAANKGSFGLMGIKERALMMGGRYDILSSQNNGTTITICVPMEIAGCA